MERDPTSTHDPRPPGGEGFGTGRGDGYDDPPPSTGWDYAPPPPPRSRLDFAPFFAILDALRRALPRDLQGQFTSLVREALLTLRALIDWYLERLDRPPREPRVEDIPID
jgi:hypothetical protein